MRKGIARIFTIFMGAIVLASGCATRPRVTGQELSKKREEIEVLQDELSVVIRNLNILQEKIAKQGGYPTEAQARDLDRFILIIRQARDKVAAEDRRIHRQYRISYGILIGCM